MKRVSPIVLLVLAFLSASRVASIAQIPGHWELVYSLQGWKPVDMRFADATHGICLANKGWLRSAALQTRDGGKSWSFHEADTTVSSVQFKEETLHSFDMPDARNAFEVIGYEVLATHDSGTTWEVDADAFPHLTDHSYLRMFTSGRGSAISARPASVWNTWDSARVFYDVQESNLFQGFYDAIFLDTLEFWGTYGGGLLGHSIDGGFNWQTDTVIDSLSKFYELDWISETPDRQRFYLLFSRSVSWNKGTPPPFHADFAETTDDGKTWRIDSSIGEPAIYRLSSPAPGVIWAMVGQVPLYSDLAGTIFGGSSLFYSSNDGQNWLRDSTFSDDTLTEMRWPDSTHGFITAWRDSTLMIYRFIPNMDIVNGVKHRSDSLNIFPNPAGNDLQIQSGLMGTARLFDLLGREVLEANHNGSGITLDVSKLEEGTYFLRIGTQSAKVEISH